MALVIFGPQLIRASKVKEKSAPEGGFF